MAQSRTSSKCKSITLFGGDDGWDAAEWTAQDDSVRGGSSASYLDIEDGKARFNGNLDIDTLGGAGFASQRTTAEDKVWDLSDFAGIQLDISKGDKRRYTITIKDELPQADADSTNGRDKATISFEVDFELPPQDKPDETHDKTVFLPFEAFVATYRGKVQKDADPLDTKAVKRFSLMIRSFFGAQEGDFSLSIRSIKAVCEAPSPGDVAATRNSIVQALDARKLEEGLNTARRAGKDSQVKAYYTWSGQVPGGVLDLNLKVHRRAAQTLMAVGLVIAAYYYFCR